MCTLLGPIGWSQPLFLETISRSQLRGKKTKRQKNPQKTPETFQLMYHEASKALPSSLLTKGILKVRDRVGSGTPVS